MAEKVPRAIHTGELKIGNTSIACAVLEDGTRLLTQWDFYRAIGRSGRPAGGRGSDVEKVAPFLALDNLKPFVSQELADSTKPIVFRTPRGTKAYGYRAELLPQVCEVYLQAYDDGKLLETQEKFAKACSILMRGLAHVGIIALVDEATGYQEVRDKAALQAILDEYLDTQFAKWAKRFPDEFYMEMFRLRGWQWKGMRVNRPQAVAGYTKDIVYSRMLPGLVTELEKRNPVIPEIKRRKGHHHRLFTADLGIPELTAHIHAVTALMKASTNWDQFKRLLQRAFPKLGSTISLPLTDDDDLVTH
jgi:P63C domain-containing protein